MVYLICFKKKLAHAKHYLGFAETDIHQRVARHRSGGGSKLMAAVTKAGIPWLVARIWRTADRNFERSLKNKKNTKFLCPLCNKKITMIITENKIKVTYAMMAEAGMTRGNQLGVPRTPLSLGLKWVDVMELTDEDFDAIEDYFIKKKTA